MARKQAQEWVLREVILLDPEPQTAEADEADEARTRRTCSGGCRTRRRGRHRTGGTWRTTRTCSGFHRGPGLPAPGGEQLAPSGAKARIGGEPGRDPHCRAAITAQGRSATPDEQAVLARWSSWGAVPPVFDADPATSSPGPARRAAVAADRPRSTSAARAHHDQRPLHRPGHRGRDVGGRWPSSGLTGGRVLEPGCGVRDVHRPRPGRGADDRGGAGPDHRPDRRRAVPGRDIRAESFADTRYPAGVFRRRDRERAVRRRARCTTRGTTPAGMHAQPLHPQVVGPDPTRRHGRGADLHVHAGRGQNPAARREMHAAGRPARRGPAADRRAPPHRRHRGGHRPADPAAPRTRPSRPATTTWLAHRAPVDIARTQARTGSTPTSAAHPDRVLGGCRSGTACTAATPCRPRRRPGRHRRAAGRRPGRSPRPRSTGLGVSPPRPRPTRAAGAAHVPEPGVGWAHHPPPGGGFKVLDGRRRVARSPVPAPNAPNSPPCSGCGTWPATCWPRRPPASTTPRAMDDLRDPARRAYRAYVAAYGPINRITLPSAPAASTPTPANPSSPAGPRRSCGSCARDPFASLVKALESYDETAGPATPASILAERVVLPRTPSLVPTPPPTPSRSTLESRGRVDLADIAQLLGLTEPKPAPSWAPWSSRTRPTATWSRRRNTCPATSAPNCGTADRSRHRPGRPAGQRRRAARGAAGGPRPGRDRTPHRRGLDQRG